MEVLDEDGNVTADDDDEDSKNKTNEVMTHSWEEVKSEQDLWTRSKDDITEEEYQGFCISLTKKDGTDTSSHIHFRAEDYINFNSLL